MASRKMLLHQELAVISRGVISNKLCENLDTLSVTLANNKKKVKKKVLKQLKDANTSSLRTQTPVAEGLMHH